MSKDGPVKFLPLGAIIQEVNIGGRNVVLGFPKQEHYKNISHPYFGETIGRIPNRLSDGKICDLNGRDYELAKNERGITTIHGGINGWGKKIWNGPELVSRNGREATLFTLRSPDGDEGFPGEVEARVWYTVEHRTPSDGGDQTEEVILDMEYEIEMTGSEPDITETVCAMTSHGYWNIGDGPTIAGTEAQFASNLYVHSDEKQIPTGKLMKHPSIETDRTIIFTDTTPVIDDCFVLDEDVSKVPLDTRPRPLRKYVTIYHPSTKIHLEGFTTEPSFVFYPGDVIDVAEIPAVDGEHAAVPYKGPRSGIALEPTRYLNAVNTPGWRPMVLIKRGQIWGSRSRFRVWLE